MDNTETEVTIGHKIFEKRVSNRDQQMEKMKITFLCLILDSWNTAVRFFLKK
jgi:hypothetical protein